MRLCSDVVQSTMPVIGCTWVIRLISGTGMKCSSARPGMAAARRPTIIRMNIRMGFRPQDRRVGMSAQTSL